jgi:predicted ATP-grasp superfamily ATP-dependent carboligase
MAHSLWLVGASVRALANSLVQAKFRVQAADQFADADLQRLGSTQPVRNYPQDLPQLVQQISADAWLYTGGLENHPQVIAALEAQLPLYGNGSQVVQQVRKVPLLQTRLAQHGFSLPEIREEVPAGELAAWLIKSQLSAGGLRVRRADDQPLQSHEYYQRYLPGEVLGAVFIGNGNHAHLLGVSRHLPADPQLELPPFQYAGSWGPLQLSSLVRSDLERLGNVLAREFSLRGWFGVDCILDAQQQLWVLEVNPRYTASVEVLERAAGVSSAPLHMQACEQSMLDSTLLARFANPSQVVLKRVLYANQAVTISPEQSAQLLQRACDQQDIADIPVSQTSLHRGEPVLTLFATGTHEAEVLAAAAQKAAALHSLLHLSRDNPLRD